LFSGSSVIWPPGVLAAVSIVGCGSALGVIWLEEVARRELEQTLGREEDEDWRPGLELAASLELVLSPRMG
jgi:hypothetical protein